MARTTVRKKFPTWNVEVSASSAAGVDIAPNVEAQVDHWPVTGLPMISGVK
jgi:hypothetical protein